MSYDLDHHKLYAICKSYGRSDSDADILVSYAVYNTIDVPDDEKMQCAVDTLYLYLSGDLEDPTTLE